MSKYKVGDFVNIRCRLSARAKENYLADFPSGGFVWVNESCIQEDSKTYEQGLQDAWELASKCVSIRDKARLEIFNTDNIYIIVAKHTYQEALAKIEAYEESKAIKVGDVIVADDGVKCVAIDFTSDDDVIVLNENGCAEAHLKSVFKKTGRHIDIEHILEQIRGNE